MDRVTLFASKLYPRWWRERYGEEFAALLEDARPGLSGTLDVVKGALTMQLSTFSAKRVLFVGAFLGLGLGFAATFLLAPQYSSIAVISVMSRDNKDLVDTVNQLSMEVLSRKSLASMTRTLNLYPAEKKSMTFEDVLEKMRENIHIMAVKGRDIPAFQISFNYPDRAVAQKVASALAGGFIDANVFSRNPAKPKFVTLEIKEIASLPVSPVLANRGSIALAGMGTGLLLSAGVALVLHSRRKRQPAA